MIYHSSPWQGRRLLGLSLSPNHFDFACSTGVRMFSVHPLPPGHRFRRPLRPVLPGVKFAGSQAACCLIARSSNSFVGRRAEQKRSIQGGRISVIAPRISPRQSTHLSRKNKSDCSRYHPRRLLLLLSPRSKATSLIS